MGVKAKGDALCAACLQEREAASAAENRCNSQSRRIRALRRALEMVKVNLEGRPDCAWKKYGCSCAHCIASAALSADRKAARGHK